MDHQHSDYATVRLPKWRPFPRESFLRCTGCSHRVARITDTRQVLREMAEREGIRPEDMDPQDLANVRPVIDMSESAIPQTRSRPPWMWLVEIVNRYRALLRVESATGKDRKSGSGEQNLITFSATAKPPPGHWSEDTDAYAIHDPFPQPRGFTPAFGWFGADVEPEEIRRAKERWRAYAQEHPYPSPEEENDGG